MFELHSIAKVYIASYDAEVQVLRDKVGAHNVFVCSKREAYIHRVKLSEWFEIHKKNLFHTQSFYDTPIFSHTFHYS